MRGWLGALVVVLVVAAVVLAARPGGASTSEPAPARTDRAVPAAETPPSGARPPRPPAPDIACAYPADLPRPPDGCAPRRNGPLTPGGVPARPWLTRG